MLKSGHRRLCRVVARLILCLGIGGALTAAMGAQAQAQSAACNAVNNSNAFNLTDTSLGPLKSSSLTAWSVGDVITLTITSSDGISRTDGLYNGSFAALQTTTVPTTGSTNLTYTVVSTDLTNGILVDPENNDFITATCTAAPPPPTVTAVSPNKGRTAGGTVVTITGTNLTGATAVNFGGNPATSLTVTATSITATSPPGTAGIVDVTVITPSGTSATSAADQFTYIAPPTVTAVSPNKGRTAGGTVVTITGTNLTGATAVNFGANPATSLTVNSATSITATSPAGSAGVVDVTVVTPGGTSATSTADQFTYFAPPTVTAVSPNKGPTAGGTVVTITGTNLTGATAVNFGANAATSLTVNSATSITATSPTGSAGVVDVTVVTPGGTSATGAADQFTYVALPTVTAVSPNKGPTAGGTVVTITGTNFTGATAVNFGSNAATSVTVNSATSITATSPAGSAGVVDVTVATPGGTSATSAADQFTYNTLPTVTAVSPTTGTVAGGTFVTITGTNLTGATAVNFGANAATSVTVISATSITATSPAGSAGVVDVTVTTPGGTSATSAADQFTYNTLPTVTAVSPTTGTIAGGTSVTITGSNLNGATAVNFGSNAATSVTVNSATSITATSPAGSAGVVDVTVTTPNGTSTTSAADQFTYFVPPAVTSITPGNGPIGGNTSVTITGANFTGATSVRFGTATASFTVNSASQITATSPSGSAGTVDVTVTTPGGTSATSTADQFTYGGARTWVSSVGNDTDPCSRTAPCLTFAGAMASTTPGGEINCLDPGDFGTVTIKKALKIICGEFRETSASGEAGIIGAGTDGIVVSAGPTDVVVLEGLDIEGLGTGTNGINIVSGTQVYVLRCKIHHFTGNGVNLNSSVANSQVIVKDFDHHTERHRRERQRQRRCQHRLGLEYSRRRQHDQCPGGQRGRQFGCDRAHLPQQQPDETQPHERRHGHLHRIEQLHRRRHHVHIECELQIKPRANAGRAPPRRRHPNLFFHTAGSRREPARVHPLAGPSNDREHRLICRHHPHIVLQLRHVFFGGSFLRERPRQHVLGFEHRAAGLDPSSKVAAIHRTAGSAAGCR